jgi:hypothetical protein
VPTYFSPTGSAACLRDLVGFVGEQSWTIPGLTASSKNIIKVILFHEFIHAYGLEDHTPGDVFQDYPNVEGDYVKAGNVKMPPIFISGATISRTQSNWTQRRVKSSRETENCEPKTEN